MRLAQGWLANLNQGGSHFPRNIRSSYEPRIHYQREDSCAY